NNLRTDIMALQDELKDWPDGALKEFTWTEVSYDQDGNPTVTEHSGKLTKEQAEGLLDKLNSQLSSANDISELKKFDLQRMYQDYQQGIGTLTAIMKDMHDTAKQMLNNMKA